ncbi:helix-turn-helix domain-containing protein [Catenulispora pinisilvae]|uniref:helix-turn-helix domain-containing protein n=1 Tax=Catenulispora pinisilvae TaxID=2705253 RepID=UPI0034DD11A6
MGTARTGRAGAVGPRRPCGGLSTVGVNATRCEGEAAGAGLAGGWLAWFRTVGVCGPSACRFCLVTAGCQCWRYSRRIGRVCSLLCVDEARVGHELAWLVGVLKAARRECGDLPQRRLAVLLGVSVTTVQDWERGEEYPRLAYLIAWARVFGLGVVIVDGCGEWVRVLVVREPGEGRDVFEVRRLVVTLRWLRECRMSWRSQAEVARAAGVSRASLVNWEGGAWSPHGTGFMRWVLALGCRVELRPVPGGELVT